MAADRITLDTLKAHALTLVSLRPGQAAWNPKDILAALTRAAETISSDPEILIRASTRAALMDEGPGRIAKPAVIAMQGLHWETAYGSPLRADGTITTPSTKARKCDDCHQTHSGPAPDCCPPTEHQRRTADDADFRRRALTAIHIDPAPDPQPTQPGQPATTTVDTQGELL